MNDSFLEDLELVSNDAKNVNNYPLDRHITTRTATSSPLQHLPPTKGDSLHNKSDQTTFAEKQSGAKELNAKDLRKLSDHDTRKQHVKVRVSERRERPVENKLKPIENKVKNDEKEHEIKEDAKVKIRETRVKISDSKVVGRDRSRRPGSYKENNQASDPCVKENSRPDGLKETTLQVEGSKDKGKSHDSVKKSDSKESDPVALLTAFKDIVSVYTKQESTKILRTMQELHINAQATLIKQLLMQTDDLISEMHPNKDSTRMRGLIDQNERLKEDVIILQRRNEELQRKLEDFEFLKQENIALKLKCKELSKQ